MDRHPRRGARRPAPVAADPPGAGHPARAGARYAGPHLLQGRVGVPGRVPTSPTPPCPRPSTTSRKGSPGSPPRPAPASGAARCRSPRRCSISSARSTWCALVRAEALSPGDDGNVGAESSPPGRRSRPPRSLGSAISDAVRDAVGRDDTHYSLDRSSITCSCTRGDRAGGQDNWRWRAKSGPTSSSGRVVAGRTWADRLPFVPDAGVELLAVEPSSCPTLTTAVRVRLRRHRRHDAVPGDVHPGPRLRAPPSMPGPALPRRRPDHLQPGPERSRCGPPPTPRARSSTPPSSPPGPRAHPRAGDRPRHPGRDRRGARGGGAGKEKVILFSYSGHGLLDLGAYDDYLHGRLIEV